MRSFQILMGVLAFIVANNVSNLALGRADLLSPPLA
jgi:hypothetical protein